MAVCVCAEVPGLRFINPLLLFLDNFIRSRNAAGEKKAFIRSRLGSFNSKYHAMIHCDEADKPNESIWSFRYLVSEKASPPLLIQQV